MFISHLHADHVGDMPTLLWSLAKSGRRDPVEHEWDFASMGGHPSARTITTEVPYDRTATVYERNGVTITSFPVIHMLDGAVGYRVTEAHRCPAGRQAPPRSLDRRRTAEGRRRTHLPRPHHAGDRTGDYRRLATPGAGFTATWLGSSDPAAAAALLAERPRIPTPLDAELLRSAEAVMQVGLRGDQDGKKAVRRAFWDAVATGIAAGGEEAEANPGTGEA